MSAIRNTLPSGMSVLSWWVTVWVVPLVLGCASGPSARLDSEARALGFVPRTIHGTEFRHRIYFNRSGVIAGSRLHVYLGGDGTPWLGPGRPAVDPTPREPLVLRLMALDSAPSLYLGRPCYLGLNHSANCHSWHWTHGRYGEPVVASLAAVLQRILEEGGVSDLVLIGHSGGGALAMLLAERISGVSAVVTLAGNLDVVEWTRLHAYSPLRGSLNPADRAPLPPRILQWHWLGALDSNIPPNLVEPVVADGVSTRVEVLPGIDHSCCWEAVWPQLLKVMELQAETF